MFFLAIYAQCDSTLCGWEFSTLRTQRTIPYHTGLEMKIIKRCVPNLILPGVLSYPKPIGLQCNRPGVNTVLIRHWRNWKHNAADRLTFDHLAADTTSSSSNKCQGRCLTSGSKRACGASQPILIERSALGGRCTQHYADRLNFLRTFFPLPIFGWVDLELRPSLLFQFALLGYWMHDLVATNATCRPDISSGTVTGFLITTGAFKRIVSLGEISTVGTSFKYSDHWSTIWFLPIMILHSIILQATR